MHTGIEQILLIVSFVSLLAAMIVALIRLFKGPESSDRVIALDLIASIIVGYALLFSILLKNAHYFDVAIVITLVSFIGTIATSIYLKQKK